LEPKDDHGVIQLSSLQIQSINGLENLKVAKIDFISIKLKTPISDHNKMVTAQSDADNY